MHEPQQPPSDPVGAPELDQQEPVPETVVHLDSVWRRFGAVDALVNLNLRVPRGTITVLLGPNGAGKTTATRIITGAISPNAGTVRVFGLDPEVDGETVRRRCGVVSAKPALYDRLSGKANLGYSAELYGLGRGPEVDERIHEAASRFGIEEALDTQVGGYSTGMKTRLALARSVLHEPDLLLFDEPTSGLDPESSHAVLEMIHDMTGGGVTVVMCTHLLLEAEGLAEQVVVLEGGTALVAGPPVELIREFWPTAVVRLDAEDPSRLAEVAKYPGVRRVEAVGEGLDALAGFGSDADGDTVARLPRTGVDVDLEEGVNLADLVGSLIAAGIRLTRVEPRIPSLEDLYFAVRRRRSGDAAISEDGGRRLHAERPRDRRAPAPPPPPAPTANRGESR